MIDYDELMRLFSAPRPNGSPAERQTAQTIRDWLDRRGIPYQVHGFRCYPYFFEAIGVWVILSRTLLALAIGLRWGWLASLIAAVGLVGGTLDVLFHLPVVSWPGARRAENILVEFDPDGEEIGSDVRNLHNPPPAETVRQEIIFSAHYDSKTELLDHYQRLFLLKNVRAGILLTALLGLIGPVDQVLFVQGSQTANLSYLTGTILALPLLLFSWVLGLNLSLGRLVKPSLGAVDNGASCAVLLGLTAHLRAAQTRLQRTRVNIAFFTGEEAGAQGSRAYVNWRNRQSGGWPVPAAAINLEVMAQDGEYVVWEMDGTVFKLVPTSVLLNQIISESVNEVTGASARPYGPVLSDGYSFLAHGIPATTMGTLDTILGMNGFHRPSDNLQRVRIDRIPEAIAILARVLDELERQELALDS